MFGLIFHHFGDSQTNLVLNEGFEETTFSFTGSRELRKPGYLAKHWYSPLKNRSPHLFKSPERGVAKANSGNSAVGLVLGGSKQEKTKFEYITGELSAPLVAGQSYCVTFSVLLHRTSKWAASNVGLLFHHDKNLINHVEDLRKQEADIYMNDKQPVTNTKWQEYNAYFVASGGEVYVSFGMFGEAEAVEVKELGMKPYFKVDGFQNKAYYQLDDVSVIAKSNDSDCGCADPPIVNEDTVIVAAGLKPYLFVLDASGSMKKNALFDSLRTNLVELLEHLPKGTPITFSIFSTNSDPIYAGILDSDTPQKVDSLLLAVKLSGGTNVYEGLREASISWGEDGVQDSARIVLISDGNFIVSNRIVAVVKNEYEKKGRKLTSVHIESEAKHAEKLEPYEANFVNVEASELRSAIFHIYENNSAGGEGIPCDCIEEYNDTMNYHFVIDYSGSMKLNKGRAIRAVKKLYEQAPSSAIVSITAFSTTSEELYVGKKSDMSVEELSVLLKSYVAKGGTDPTPGVIHGLGIAKEMADKRFSHLIVVTDLNVDLMNDIRKIKGRIKLMAKEIDLAASCVAVDINSTADLLVSGRTQFDLTSGVFREVSKAKFEKDLFETFRRACDYTTQAYHYNPAGDAAKKEAKKFLRVLFRELIRGGFN